VKGPLGFVLGHPLNRHRPFRALADYLGWQLRSRLVPGDHVHSWVMGTRFYARRGETGLTGNIYAGLHEYRDMAFAYHLLGHGDLFVDLGANVGSYTILVCGAAGADGIAVEPLPAAFARLEANVALNGLRERVHCVNVGLANKKGTLSFSADFDTMNHVVDKAMAGGNSVQVKVVALDSLLKKEKPVLLKMDLEGYELPVLRGGSRVLARGSLLAVICEVNQAGNRYGHHPRELFLLMKKSGFKSFLFDPFSRRLSLLAPGRQVDGNVIFARSLEKIRARLKKAPVLWVNGLAL